MDIDALFLVDLDRKQKSWGTISDQQWFGLIKVLEPLGMTSFGFQDVDQLSKLAEFTSLDPHQLVAMGPRVYEPFHSESLSTILPFEWNDYAKSVFLEESFDQWNAANDALPTDEIVWFDKEQARIVAVPYENLIQFKALSENDIELLSKSIAQFSNQIYDRDLNLIQRSSAD